MRERSRRLKLILCGVLVMSCLTALVFFSGTQGFLQLGWGSIKIKKNQAFASGIAADDRGVDQGDFSFANRTTRTQGTDGGFALTGRVPEQSALSEEGNSKSGKDGATAEKRAEPALDGSGLQSGAPALKDAPVVPQSPAQNPKPAPAAPKPAPTVPKPPAAKPKPAPAAPQPPVPAPQVTYAWSYSNNYRFRAEVIITNKGSEVSQDVKVHLPMLENNSPYQTTALQSTNFDVVSTAGRISTFHLGEIQPGESKSLVADYAITLRSVSIKSTNNTVEKARQAYNQYAGSGNCHTLATAFVKRCRELGLTARVVTGFARPQRADLTAGSLQGCRHSWAEYYVEGLGWVPVDLTFKYFSCLPLTSHIVETYADASIRINFSGGQLSASWANSIR